MRGTPFEHLTTLPDDWDSWLVYADQLTQRGDELGEWLVREHRGEREAVATAADERIVQCAEWLGHRILGTWWWLRRLAPLGEAPTPPDLRKVFAQPLSQLLAFIDFDATSEPVPPEIELHRTRVFAAARAWLDRAFADPVPELGRWQELTDEKLLAAERALDQTSARTFAYWAPAVLAFELRRRAANTPATGTPYFITRVLMFLLYPHRGSFYFDQQRRLLATLDRGQRAAIFACILVIDREPPGQDAWRRVWDAEREGPRDDWWSLFTGSEPVAAPPATTPAKKRPATKRPATKKHAAKAAATKPAAQKSAVKKHVRAVLAVSAAAKKPAAKKPVAKKPATNRPVVKKSAAKKPVAKKPATNRPVVKKSTAKKSETKRR